MLSFASLVSLAGLSHATSIMLFMLLDTIIKL
jgi:hypothetical protein